MFKNSEIFSMIVQELKGDDYLCKFSDKVKQGNFFINDTRFDNFYGGRTFYEVILELPLKIYNQIDTSDMNLLIRFFEDKTSFFVGGDNIIIEKADIRPIIETIVDWDAINGVTTPEEILNLVNIEYKFLESIATGRDEIKRCNDGYKENHVILCKYLKLLVIEPVNNFNDLWEWYDFYKSNNLATYQSRREYIKKIYKPIIDLLNSHESSSVISNYKKTGIELVDESVFKIQQDLEKASDRIDYNQIGVRCRETINLLAREIYIDSLHHPQDFQDKISSSDSKRMIEGFMCYQLSGSNNEIKRKFLRTTLELANELTHSNTATRLDALLTLEATIALVNLISIIRNIHK